MDIAKIKIDSAKIEAGEWVGNIPDMGDLKLRVRGLGSIAYRQALDKARRAVPRGEIGKDGILSVAQVDLITGQAYHASILLDWSGMEADGTAQSYNADLALTLLTDPDYRLFFNAVSYAAQTVTESVVQHDETLLGNSAAA